LHEHAVAEIAVLLGDPLKLLPVLPGIQQEGFDALASSVAVAPIRPRQGRPPLDVSGRALGEEGVDITPVVDITHLLGDVHFVSGHVGPIIAQARAGVESYKRGIRSSGELSKTVDHAQDWQGGQ
jgi:hypothetical protein